MPISKHFSGHGEEVASHMQKQYGGHWEKVFYATENARKKHHVAREMDKAKKKRRGGSHRD